MFDKNLELIDNISLKRRLIRVSNVESRMGVSYCVTPSNDYVLLKDEVASDDLNNPREAIKKMLQSTIKSEMKQNDIIITFGIGLCYLLDEVYNKYPSKIYIYEPDLNLLHFVLSNVDITEHLSSGRVFITNDMDELLNKLSNSYLTRDKVEIVYLQNYAVLKNKELLLLTQKVYDTCKSKMVDINTITKFSKRWMQNSIENIASINSANAYLLSDLENKYQGKTALLAAAGPSLNDNISKIQANRDKFVIFAVNKSVRFLLQNGITPDFIVCLDAGNMAKTLGGLDSYLPKINCIMDIRTDKSLLHKTFKKVFINFSENDFFIKKLADYNNFMRFYECGGSASTFALIAAIKMGFSKIIFAGLDLAFKGNILYSTGETMERVSHTEIVVDNVKKNLVQVKSVTGGMVYTREDYETFIKHFECFIKDYPHSSVYNLSSFGAQIEGVKPVSFEELELSTCTGCNYTDLAQPFKFDLKAFLEEEFKAINSIITLLSKGVFSPALVSSIVKSTMVYQYMQAEILNVLQKNFAPELASDFIDKTKASIKTIVEQLQKNKLI